LLHGFPEFWYGWRPQITPLAAAGFRVERLPDASHWVHHAEAERVTQLLIDFFAPALSAEGHHTPTT
jgi:pimeloyl-ACP methyl ester carboxylesterase